MKKSTRNELRAKDGAQLEQHVRDLRTKQAQLRFDIRSGKTAARSEEKKIRSEIAISLTLIKEKQNHA